MAVCPALRALVIVTLLLTGGAAAQDTEPAVELTRGHRQWLADHPEIRIAAYANYAPAQFLDEHGRHAGIAAEYQHLVEDMLGITFVEIPGHNWDAVLDQARSREVDVLALAAWTSDRTYLGFTAPYLELPAVIIARQEIVGPLTVDDLYGRDVGIPSGYAVEAHFHERYPKLRLAPAPNTRQGLEDVMAGKTDVFISDLAVASDIITKDGISNLHVVGETDFVYRMGFAVRSDWPELVSILDKALTTIPDEQRAEIYDRWIHLSQETGISRGRFWTTVLSGLGIAASLLLATFLWNRSLKRRVDQKTSDLRASEERTRRVIDTALDGVITMGEDGRITGWSRQAESDFGWTAAEVLGRNLADTIIPERHREAHARGLERFLESGEGPVLSARIEITALHRDGHEFPIELSIAPIRKGDAHEFSAFVRDITERKRAEEELNQHREHLEEKVAARTAALRKAKEEADIANRAKSDFLANMSHEIRTPMTAILGYAAILREDGDLENAPRERIEALDTICRNGDHLLALINDILDLSKLEAGAMTIERAPCRPAAIARDVIELMQVRADEKGLEIGLRQTGPIPETIVTDATRLRQILMNLVGNAIKFTDEGSVFVTMRLDGDHMIFSVADTGIGMDESSFATLFEPFTQADSSPKRRFGGTGLGLSISKQFAEKLGGDIVVTSRPGIGATFDVSVETGVIEDVAMIEDASGVAADGARFSAGWDAVRAAAREYLTGRRVLVAEDTPDNQRLIRHHLEKVGMTVEIAVNGHDVVEREEAARRAGSAFDAVLMDIQMPEMDGYTAARVLHDRGYEGPVIALTASTLARDRQRCIDAGMVDHVAKPIDPGVLFDALVRALGGNGSTAERLLDTEAVRARFDSPELLDEVVGMFLDQSDELMHAMRTAVTSGDLEALGRHAHRLRGCAGNFEAGEVSDAAARIERMAEEGETDRLSAAVGVLDRSVTALRDELVRLRASS